MGWLDQNGTLVNQVVDADIMSLPQNVSAQLSEDDLAQCTTDLLSEMATDPMFARCADKYTEEEMAQLQEVGTMVAGFKCFHKMFNQACADFLRNQINELVSSAAATNTEPAGRSFQWAACYSTCAAANFASTTTCTFGLFFKFTRTCNQVFPLLAAAASG